MKISISWKNPWVKVVVYAICLLLLVVASVGDIVFVYQEF